MLVDPVGWALTILPMGLVFRPLKIASKISKYYNDDLKNIHIAISGVGKVGGKLARLLSRSNVKITASSINKELINKLKSEIKISEVLPEDLFKTKCDIISPCALGGAINSKNKEK